jgi:membrane peptidoglycan carboxypeptidase
MSDEMHAVRSLRRRRLRVLARSRRPRILGWVMLLAGGSACAAVALFLLAPLPLPDPLLILGNRPEPTRFYDRTGRLLTEAGSPHAAESRWYAPAARPEEDCVLAAFLSARDLAPADWSSLDFASSLRAMADALLGRRDLAGETAAELLEINGSGRSAFGVPRLAGALAARYDRRRLAEWLINVRLYGNDTVGVDDAALTYFHSHAGELSAGQCAALEALAGDSSLAQDPAAWKNARNAILNRMLNFGYLEKETWRKASAEAPAPAVPVSGESATGNKLPFLDAFLRRAVTRLGDRYPSAELPRAGLRVFTTLDLDFELQALCTAQNLISQPSISTEPVPTLEGKPCDMAALLGPAAGGSPPEDAALAVMDPESGEVLAYFDSARSEEPAARGGIGTAILPFVFLSAFTRGFTPSSMLLDIPRTGAMTNPDGEYLGPISARTALQKRRLAAADGMAENVGGDHIARTFDLLNLGGDGEVGFEFAQSLGQSVELLSLTQTYGLLASSGLEVGDPHSTDPPLILRVEKTGGGTVGNYADRQTHRIFGSDLAFLLQDILSDESGRTDLTAPALAGSRSSLGAMLGEDPAGQGAWAFAFTPKFVIGVRGKGNLSESQSSWILAQAVAGWILRSLPEQHWAQPTGIVREDICVPSGLLPSRYCPEVSSEIFLAGTEPAQVDTFYRPVAVNRETGRLATLWTPLALVDEDVFFILTGEARVWAEQSGFPVPPETYDTLPDSFPYYDDLHISNPTALEILRGMVILRGAAAVSGMSRYAIQAGPGLYPGTWYTLAAGAGPVSEGDLTRWDTSGLDGVWSIQLTAVYPDGKIVTVAIPVTLDNTPPAIRWIEPAAPKRLSVAKGGMLILQVDATDNLGLAEVDFLIDGTLRTRLERGPFSVRWSGLAAGRHTVKICALDQAGNESCTVDMQVEAD